MGKNNGRIGVGKNEEIEWDKNGKQEIDSPILSCHVFIYNEGKEERLDGDDIIPPSVNIIPKSKDASFVQLVGTKIEMIRDGGKYGFGKNASKNFEI